MIFLDDYVFDVLLRDLVGHDRQEPDRDHDPGVPERGSLGMRRDHRPYPDHRAADAHTGELRAVTASRT